MAAEKKVAPYGHWESLISSDLISGSNNVFKEVHVNPANGLIYLVEGRPSEGGRYAVVEFSDSGAKDILPIEYSVSSKVHEYGGGAAAINRDGCLIFTDSNTSGVFRYKSEDDIQPIVEADNKLRYADFDSHPKDTKWVLAIQEDHRGAAVENRVVLINSETKTTENLCTGADFYSHPKFSHDGRWVSWIQWRHPDMPWTGSWLCIATWLNGKIGSPKFVAGKAEKESIAQPRWHTYGGLMFMSDRTGFYQLYMYEPRTGEVRPVPVKGYEGVDLTVSKEMPGNCTYVELNPAAVAITYTRNAANGIILVGIASGKILEVPIHLVDITTIRRVSNTKFALIASSTNTPTAIYTADIQKFARTLLKQSTSIFVDPSIFSPAQHITFPRTQGKDPTGVAHAIIVAPHNPSFSAPAGTNPPLIVQIHGGPNAHTPLGLNLTTQYWTSRGYAYAHVNYTGSTGYGRAYRESLNGAWGVKDVDDAASCVVFLVETGLVDGSRVGIVGHSSGGYTVLQALIHYPALFAAGSSKYGIGNLKTLVAGSHKFESHYGTALLYPRDASVEDREKIDRERSPCFHADKIESPLLLLQGAEDKVVPLQQSVEVEKVMRERGKDVKLVIFEGEGHGFRRRENVKRAIEEEEDLWKRTLLKERAS